jgi:hypothetical protein
MKEVIAQAMQSRAGRAAGFVIGALLLTFIAGYVVFGPLALRLLPR